VVGGNGYAFEDSYFVLGFGVSHYLADGLSIGLSAESWTGGEPVHYKLSPSVQYVFHQVTRVAPYIGAFYRRTWIDNWEDLDSVGGRAGAYFALGRNAHIGVAAVHESCLDCTEATYRECSTSYPEISLTVAF
jgi:hypothetical protein